jgi:hypothetical protein
MPLSAQPDEQLHAALMALSKHNLMPILLNEGHTAQANLIATKTPFLVMSLVPRHLIVDGIQQPLTMIIDEVESDVFATITGELWEPSIGTGWLYVADFLREHGVITVLDMTNGPATLYVTGFTQPSGRVAEAAAIGHALDQLVMAAKQAGVSPAALLLDGGLLRAVA